MRLQLALNVADIETAIDFYKKVFDVEVNKREPGYANFVVANPPLKLVLFESPDAKDRLNHLGVEVFEDADVDAAHARLENAGIENERDQEQVCCYAAQNKVQTTDPQGLMWEWYRVLEDSPNFFGAPATEEENKAAAACCG